MKCTVDSTLETLEIVDISLLIAFFEYMNGQGNIVGLFDNTGTHVVTYTYDTWGSWQA